MVYTTDYAANKAATALDADMTVKELAEALALMRFSGDRLRLVAIDKDVRDFLVSLVTARHGKA